MDYDLAIIGAGWAGFNAAVAAARLGKKVCLLEERQIGGTCLNRGCIPTKSFVHHSKQGLPFLEIQKKKNDVVLRLKAGMESLIKSSKVEYVSARAKIEKNGMISTGKDRKIKAKFILIATGSSPKELLQLKIDHKHVISSDDVLDLQEAPKKILIIGGGVIGCEFASIFKRLGVDVTIVEIASQLLPGFDSGVSKKLEQAFQKNGITVYTGKSFESMNLKDYDKVLLAVGRSSACCDLWDESLGIKIEGGSIFVDRQLRTDVRHIFAAGDCIGGYMLAHVAAYEGELAVRNMFLAHENRDYSAIPSSVFTYPEVAAIGTSEDEAKKFGADYKANTVYFLSIGMAHILEETQGFVKVIVDNKTGRILGASMIGAQSSELVNAFSIVLKNNVTISGLRKTIFAHPSISEIMAEVAKGC